MKKRYFPCPYCKGRGNLDDGEFVDVGVGGGGIQVSAHTPCSYCEEQGMIEINGDVHMRRKFEKEGMKHLLKDREYSWEEVREIGSYFLNLEA